MLFRSLVPTSMGKHPCLFQDLVILNIEPPLVLSPDIVTECSVKVGVFCLYPLPVCRLRFLIAFQVLLFVAQDFRDGAVFERVRSAHHVDK